MKLIKPASLAAMLTAILMSCNQHPAERDQKLESADAAASATFDTAAENYNADTVTQQTPAAPDAPDRMQDWDKKIIKTADLQVQVGDYKKFNAELHRGLKQFGAYIAQEEQASSDYRIENSVVIKIPAAYFDDAVSFLTPDSLKVHEKKISSQDVTGEMIDVRSRMQARREVRQRYIDLLKQAKSTKDILELQKEINEIQENIEAVTGRLDYLSHAASYSTINIRFYQILDGYSPETKEPGFFEKLWDSFKVGLNWLAEMFILSIALWPLWTGIGVAIFMFRRWRAARLRLKN
jgi:hypothetical protein